MIQIIPRPYRDIICGPFQIRNNINVMKNQKDGSAGAALIGCFGGGFLTLPLAENIIKGTLRTALAAAGAFALFKLNISLPVASVVASTVSLPSVCVAGGSWLLGNGAAATISALSSGSFAALGVGFLSLGAGWLVLEKYDLLPIGLGEKAVDKITDDWKGPLIDALA